MDADVEIKILLAEETFVDNLISQLKELKSRKGYSSCLEDTVNLLEKLEDKRKRLKIKLDDATDELIAIAAAIEGADSIQEADYIGYHDGY